MLFSSNPANLGWQILEKVICKDPTIGYDFFIRSPKQNPEISRVIFFKKKNYSDFKSGAITKSEIFKKPPYWGKMTTRGSLATLVLIITFGSVMHMLIGLLTQKFY